MSVSTSMKNEALGKLLANLFPNVALSGVGVALLAAQISDLGEDARRCRIVSTISGQGQHVTLAQHQQLQESFD